MLGCCYVVVIMDFAVDVVIRSVIFSVVSIKQAVPDFVDADSVVVTLL